MQTNARFLFRDHWFSREHFIRARRTNIARKVQLQNFRIKAKREKVISQNVFDLIKDRNSYFQKLKYLKMVGISSSNSMIMQYITNKYNINDVFKISLKRNKSLNISVDYTNLNIIQYKTLLSY